MISRAVNCPASSLATFNSDDFRFTASGLTFNNDQRVRHDTDTQDLYNPTQWIDHDGDVAVEGTDVATPLSYVRSRPTADNHLKVTPTFYITGDPRDINTQQGAWYLVGDDKGVATSDHELEAAASFAADGTEADGTNKWVVTTGMITSTEALGDLIWLGDLKIAWRLEYRDMQATPVAQTTYGESKNRLYVTGGAAPGEFETVLYLGCSGAYGKRPAEAGENISPAEDANNNQIIDDGEDANSNQVLDPAGAGFLRNESVTDGVWTKFASRELTNVAGEPLVYWGPLCRPAAAQNEPLATSARLLDTKNGECGAFMHLLIGVLRAQGVSSEAIKIQSIYANDPNANPQTPMAALLINNYTFLPVTEYPEIDGFLYRPGEYGGSDRIPSQNAGNESPRAFALHLMVRSGGRYFDPSYGGSPLANEAEWENRSLAGFARLTQTNEHPPLVPDGDAIASSKLIARKNDESRVEVTFTVVDDKF